MTWDLGPKLNPLEKNLLGIFLPLKYLLLKVPDNWQGRHVELQHADCKDDEVDCTSMNLQIDLWRKVNPGQIVFVNHVFHDNIQESNGTDEGGGYWEHDHHGEYHELAGVMFPKPELVTHCSVYGCILSWRFGGANLNHEPEEIREWWKHALIQIQSYRR